MNVKPLVKHSKPSRTIQEPLGDAWSDKPFLMLISAKVASGKSTTLAYMLKKVYNQYFDKIYFCSSNIYNGKIKDPAYETIHIPEKRLYDDFNSDIMNEIKEDIMNDEDFEDSQYLLVIDDLPTELNKRTSAIVKQFLKHRHLHLSIIITTQKLNLLNLSIRNNASHLIVFKTNNQNERKSLATMVEINENLFYEYLDYATEEKYNFLFVDLSVSPTCFYKNFTEKLN
jgi:DNA helicase HerA-like ATPase